MAIFKNLLLIGMLAGTSVASQPAAPNADSAGVGGKEALARTSTVFNEIAQKAVPAVVSIMVLKKSPKPLAAGLDSLPGIMPPGSVPGAPENGSLGTPGLPDLPGSPPGTAGSEDDADSRQAVGIGSGVIIRANGTILTNNHVVEAAQKITVTLGEKKKLSAHVLGTDSKTDLAVIQLDRPQKNLPVLDFADSDQIRVGDWAVAIGSPFGLNRSVSSGIISAKGRAQMGILDVEDFIQTDAAINPGSSGGPLLNANGDVIGINTAIFSEGGGFMGIGFAIPSVIAKEISGQLIQNGRVIRGWIGLSAQDLNEGLAKYFNAPNQQRGALVSDVAPEGPGKQAALHPGDIVLKYNNTPINTAGDLKAMVGKTKAGTEIPMEIARSGKKEKVSVTIRENPEARKRPEPPASQEAGIAASNRHPAVGMAVEDIPEEISKALQLSPGNGVIVVAVKPGGAAFDAGITPGDIILRAGTVPIGSAKEFNRLSKKLGPENMSVLYVQRGPAERIFVSLIPDA